MELKALKLFIINQVLQTQDSEVLQTVANVLSAAHNPTAPSEHFTPEWEVEEDFRSNYTEDRTRDLQKSIDELFNP